MEKQDKKRHKTGENKALNELKAMFKINEYNVDFYNTLKYRRLQNMANFRDLSHQNRRKQNIATHKRHKNDKMKVF